MSLIQEAVKELEHERSHQNSWELKYKSGPSTPLQRLHRKSVDSQLIDEALWDVVVSASFALTLKFWP